MEKILDNRYYDFIISNALVTSYNTGDNITKMNEMYSLLHVPKKSMQPCDLGLNSYHRFPDLYTLESVVSTENSNEKSEGINPEMGLFGRGVIVGLIDTGIDYRHPAFMNNDTTTRILRIWDQTVEGSSPPAGFTFGSEYTKELINFALLSQYPYSIVPTTDPYRHGTAIASIIAGRPNEKEGFGGVVPQADLAVVKLKEAKENLKNLFCVRSDALCYQESDIILAIRYLLNVATRLNRPLVICLALGTNQGGHDGRGALSAYLDSLMQLPKLSMITSAGNEGSSRRHYYGKVTMNPFSDSLQLNSGEIDKEYFMEIWPYMPAALSVQITAPTWETAEVIKPGVGECIKLNFQSIKTNIWVNNILFEEETGNQLILLRFRNMISGTWYIKLENLNSVPFSYHCWLPSGNLISNETYFVNSSPDTTVTILGNTSNLLTVTAYNQNVGTIMEESSIGYTRLGQVKPDLAAPGYRIPCAIPDFQYGTISGTGAAAAHVAGAAVMMIEWAYIKGNYTAATGNQTNRLMMKSADRDPVNVYPNPVWGYGKLSIDSTLKQLLIY
ncbi:S8 family peptidase [Lacrimispora amygdalina]|uniref:S8 family peptidase n=1 Tax=Lacrimispora amygdalina TaxID=253257 RepID=UPI000BE3A7B7|nr:S8 family peptidase [Lacrimispora amygdalina]